jgi:proteasome assembly chaperone (PAC2) family protein
MILVETIPGMGKRGIKEMVERVNSSMIYLLYCKNFCKCHTVLHPSKPYKNKNK